MSEKLTAEEDAVLRRLHALADIGALSGSAAQLYEDLRSRDRRTVVRPVQDVIVPEQREAHEPGPVVSRR